jgi:hypothetical protein
MKTDEEMQNTPDLDQAMKEGQITFDGGDPEAAAAPIITGTPGPDRATAQEEEKNEELPANEKTAKVEETPEEIAARQKKEDMPPETTFRFKDHPEAEKGYRELQGRTTKAEQRARTLEEELNRIKNAERIEAEAKAAKESIIDYAATRRAKALEEIDGLDPEDKEYRKKAATCLSQADIDIYEHYQAHGRSGPGAAESPASGPTAAPPADTETTVAYVKDQIVADGIEADDPLFWQYAGHAPVTDEQGRPTTLDTQIKWAVSQTKQYHTNIRTKLKAEEAVRVAEEVRKKQAADLPLGRGTSGGGTPTGRAEEKQDNKPVSLSDAVDFATERRRL